MKNICFIIFIFFTVPFYGQQVNLKVNDKEIPTYKIGPAQINPIFFTGRVYQGAEGYVYPYPLYDILTDTIENINYKSIELENQFIHISVLPEMGGRIFSANDKTNNYNFFYNQSGIKPALIGMNGAWLSGGVEWNVPDHHRPSSYMPINWKTIENEDGSKTVWIGETELRHRLKWSVGVSVYPNRSWVKANIMVTNPTSMIQSMLYWANVSVHCNEDYQVIFPPDVQFGTDHHKVYFTDWPIGETTVGSGEKQDLSWWKNYTGDNRSIFAWGSNMNFLAGYDYKKDAGTVHVANRHIVGGKKFFLWGNNPSGMMWNKMLSDKDGHYLELMVGAYSDNQPDYSWIAPGEVREFSQIWYPIKGIKGVKNATVDAAVNFEPLENFKYRLGFCSTALYEDARVIIKKGDNIIFEKIINIDPDRYFLEEIEIQNITDQSELYVAMFDSNNNLLVDYQPVVLINEPLPDVIEGTRPVKDYSTNEELYLAGLRIDQFNNARLKYMDFYNEALKRDSMDARVNIEVGKHYLRQAKWEEAKRHLLQAQTRLAHDYTSVKNAEALYYLGNVFRLLGERDKARDSYWAATWTPTYKHRSYYELAVMAVQEKDYTEANELITQSLYVGSRDKQAQLLKAYILRMMGEDLKAMNTIDYTLQIDPLDLWSQIEKYFINEADTNSQDILKQELKNRNHGLIAVQELLEVVTNYFTLCAYEDALRVLDIALNVGSPYDEFPILHYYKAYALISEGEIDESAQIINHSNNLSHLQNYFLRTEEIEMLQTLLNYFPDNSYINYHLGNLKYYIGQKESALQKWEKSVKLNPKFSIASRNLGFAYGVKGDLLKSIEFYEMALAANSEDPLLLKEIDVISEQAAVPIEKRLKRMEKNIETVMKHDDTVMRLLLLYNMNGQYEQAINILSNRHFHSWEGGGEIHDIYVDSHLLRGVEFIEKREYEQALHEFELASLYPDNLEVAPPASGNTDAKINYFIGLAYEMMKNNDKAHEYFMKSADAPFRNNISELNYFKVRSLQKIGKRITAEDFITMMSENFEKSQNNLFDSYAKFGNESQNQAESNALYFKGLIKLLQDENQEAIDNFKRALKLFPGNIWAKNMLEKRSISMEQR